MKVVGDPNALNHPAEGWVDLFGDRATQGVQFEVPKTGPYSFGRHFTLLQWEAVVQETPKEGRFYDGRERYLPLWVYP